MENKDVVSQLHQTHMLQPDIFRFPDSEWYKSTYDLINDFLQ